MLLKDIKEKIPSKVYDVLSKSINEFRPSQEKAIKAGLFDSKNLLVCTPTASGKTLIGELAITKNLSYGMAIYIVPLKALASEKYKEFKTKYEGLYNVALSIGNLDSSDPYLEKYDIIICTAEKLDSLIRHHCPWLSSVKTVIVDEVHLLNDISRGPTLEILITILKQMLPSMQLIALSATIGNPESLAKWLEAELVQDSWRPVKLEKGIYLNGEIEFFN
jgi:ATP-dependent DNA helicase